MNTTTRQYRCFSDDELAERAEDILCDRDGEPLSEWSRERLRAIYDEMRHRNALRKAGTPAIFWFADEQ